MLGGKLFFKYSNEPVTDESLSYIILFISLCACDTSVDDAAATLLSKPWFICKSWRKRRIQILGRPSDVNRRLVYSYVGQH
jgi:hypothetical protein